jgi:succinate-semialdehyde dehydrogenase/glutarate-semialdehyde dehydrogenase
MSFSASSLKDPSLFVESAYINGRWVSAKSGETFKVSNPATEESIGSVPESGLDDLSDAIQAAHRSFESWKSLSGRQRGRILRKVFELLIENKEDLSTIISAENGKVKADAMGEVM